MYQNTQITPWFFVLHQVSQLNDAKAKDVADGLGISHPHAGITLNRLKIWGFVRRRKDSKNTGGRPAFTYLVTCKGECFMDWADDNWGEGWYGFSAEEISRLRTKDRDSHQYRTRFPQYDTKGWNEYYRSMKDMH